LGWQRIILQGRHYFLPLSLLKQLKTKITTILQLIEIISTRGISLFTGST
jgi:hypothetical protein